jgi:CelD/BcsL family acetyltransferase involved in cellulose biosynthesis
LKIAVVRPEELGAAELEAWRHMQLATPDLANPFLAADFTRAVGRVRDDTRVAVLEEGQRIVGFFPFHRGRFGAGTPIALADVQALIHTPGLTWDPRELLAGCGLAVWEFDHLLARQTPFAPHHKRATQSPIIDLSDGFPAYLERRARASERVRVARRKARKLAREWGDVRFEFESRDREGLRRVLRWKSAQYRRTGHADRFAIPWVAQLVEELFELRAEACAGSLSLVWAGDRLVAGHFGLRSERVLASCFPTYDVAAARYSPGWLLFMRMAEGAADCGLQHLDLGKGDEEYKRSLKTGDLPLAEGWVQRRSLGALARAARREPRRRATRFILDRPPLRRTARRLLRGVGHLRVRADSAFSGRRRVDR